MSISVRVGEGVFVDGKLIYSIKVNLGVCWIDGLLSNLYKETKKNTKISLGLVEIRSIILKFAETPPPTNLTALFDLTDEYTRRVVLKCIYDWGWMLDAVELTLGETIVNMSLYRQRAKRLSCFCKHVESFKIEDILQLLSCDKQSFAMLKCLFFATKSRRLFRETVQKHAWWLLDVRGGDIELERDATFGEKLKMTCLCPPNVTLIRPNNRFIVDLVNSLKQNSAIVK